MKNKLLILMFYLSVILLCGCSADIKSTLDDGQKIIEPVVNALSEYQLKHSQYPKKLDVLVAEGYINSIPTLPKKSGTVGVFPLRYQVSPDGSFYYLHFAYDFPGGIGPAELVTRYKISYEPDWGTRSYPPGFQNLVAKRVGKRFEEEGAGEALDISVNALIATAKRGHSIVCINLSRALVNRCLGKGLDVKLPKNLGKNHDVTELYQSTDGKIKYCFTYMKKNKLPKHGDYLKDPYVVNIIYEIQKQENGSEQWIIIEKCK